VAVQANISRGTIAYQTIKLGYLDKRVCSEKKDNGGTGGAGRNAVLVRVLRLI
jgi:hypothetical protein